MNPYLFYIPIIIGLAFLCIPVGRMIFGDWDHPPSKAFLIIFSTIGFTILSGTCYFMNKYADEMDKENTIYYDNLKSSIRSMDCKDLGNYIIDNADNYTLSSNQIIDLAHGIYGVKCK